MGTRATIGMLQPDDTVLAIYCHNDGYPSYLGKMLTTHYSTKSQVKKLIQLGDISQLKSKLAPRPFQRHSFDNPAKGVTLAYHRDRQEPWERTKPSIYTDKENFVNHAETSYVYLYDPKTQSWSVASYSKPNFRKMQFSATKNNRKE